MRGEKHRESFKGCRVIGVVGRPEKAEVTPTLGADVVVDRHSEDFVEVVKDVTGGCGADVIYDPVGGDAYQRTTKCIAFEGRILAGGQMQSAALNTREGPTSTELQAVPTLEAIPSARQMELACLSSQT